MITAKTGRASHSFSMSPMIRNSPVSSGFPDHFSAITRFLKIAFRPASRNILPRFARSVSQSSMPSSRISPIAFSRQNALTFSIRPLPSFPDTFNSSQSLTLVLFFLSNRSIFRYTLRSGSGSSAPFRSGTISRKPLQGSVSYSCSRNSRICFLTRQSSFPISSLPAGSATRYSSRSALFQSFGTFFSVFRSFHIRNSSSARIPSYFFRSGSHSARRRSSRNNLPASVRKQRSRTSSIRFSSSVIRTAAPFCIRQMPSALHPPVFLRIPSGTILQSPCIHGLHFCSHQACHTH